jgi:type II secretory pathway component PulK
MTVIRCQRAIALPGGADILVCPSKPFRSRTASRQRDLPRSRPRRGAILIVTLLVIFTLASLVLVLCGSTRVELAASANLAASMQAASIERGAEQYVIALLSQDTESPDDLTEEYYAGVQVGDGYFWICRPDFGDNDTLQLFGLRDEGSKLNINSATYDQLMKLPNMTDQVAGSIVDWRDADDTPTNGGAESSYYGSLPSPYTAKNAPYETVEELLLVQGVSRELLYGNGFAPPLGVPANTRGTSGQGVTDLQTARGLFDLLTVYSKEPAEATAATAGGTGGTGGTGTTGGAGTGAAAGATQKVSLNNPGARENLRQLLEDKFGKKRSDEIVAAAAGQSFDDAFAFAFAAKLSGDELSEIYDSLTVTPDQGAPPQQPKPKINVNTAPRDVLLCLPNLESADVDKMVGQRQSNPQGTDTVGWVLDALGEKASKAKLGQFINGKSSQYTADIVAVSGNGRAFKHVRIVVDASGTTPKIVYRRDFTDRGWPMEPEVLASLRAGRGLVATGTGFGSRGMSSSSAGGLSR